MALLHDEIPIAMVWDNEYNHDLKDRDKLVFGEIFTMINQGKPFIMSNKHLGERLGYSSKSISRSVKSLIDSGWISTKMVVIKDKKSNRTAREVNGINLKRCLIFSQKVHKNIKLSMDKHVQTGIDNVVQGGMDKHVHQIHQSNTSVNRSVRENASAKLHREFITDFNTDSQKVGMAINRWLSNNKKPSEIEHAMDVALIHSRVSNPNAIISYMNEVINTPMRPKHRSSNNHVYRNKGCLKRTAQIVAQHRGDVFTSYNKDDLAVAKVLIDKNMDQHSDKAIAKARKIARGDNNA